MAWVIRTRDADRHVCQVPMRGGYTRSPDGSIDDLWRCDDCATLWRIGYACPPCDARGHSWPHAGTCVIGLAWRPATLWQRIRHRRQR